MSILNVKKSISALIVGVLISSSSFAAVSKEVNESLLNKLELLKVDVDSIS